MPGFGPVDSERVISLLIAFVVAITIHEFMHAFTAYKLGDNTAAREGRVTLNPVSHFDPLGFFMLLFLIFSNFGFAWGRPVPVNPGAFRDPKRGMLLVAAAGPLSNLVQAVIFALPLWLVPDLLGRLPSFAISLLSALIFINLALASFNLIPIPPLDGHKILTGLLPNFWYPILAPLERYGFAILLLLLFLPGFFRIDLVGPMVDPVRIFLSNLILPGRGI
ncbi:MAG: Peptidase M50 [uncultured Thermomicrobiales bacterium]|uniref:Peptidase M50 n=1 Tax=uncultured Thermomicrobiales bacterium TaxID=1645740 RepID=A0A6J4V0L7_9BACT|nr:MAG: Peptidase M50 [uncultured Thermomicrobiales bacterium]